MNIKNDDNAAKNNVPIVVQKYEGNGLKLDEIQFCSVNQRELCNIRFDMKTGNP